MEPLIKYVILGCALTNLESEAYPIAVAVLDSRKDCARLSAYLLAKWQNRDQYFPDEVRADILSLIEDLTEVSPGVATEDFFEQLGSLRIGPIRCISLGSVPMELLDEEISKYFEAGDFPVSWPDSFVVDL